MGRSNDGYHIPQRFVNKCAHSLYLKHLNQFIPNNIYDESVGKNWSESLLTSDIVNMLFKNKNYLNTHPI